MNKAVHRHWRHLAEDRIQDVESVIPLGCHFWPLTPREKQAIDDLCSSDRARTLLTALHARPDKASIKVLDAAYWMKGCSSTGRLRYAVLTRIGHGKHGKMALLDLKEAVAAAAPCSARAKMPDDSAQRVVAGACALAPFLGNRMLAAHLLDKPVVLRELFPQDLKLETDELTQDEAIRAARFLAHVVGKAHARQMKEDDRRTVDQGTGPPILRPRCPVVVVGQHR